MWYGRVGVELFVNLSDRIIEKKECSKTEFEDFIGGKGVNVRRAWDLFPPELDPWSDDNVLIFTPGVLAGTIAPAANRTTVTTKSPYWKYMITSTFGGYWGPTLKFAGYDSLTITGKSDKPVYIYINNDTVEIRNASHLWGKSTYETQDAIKAELNNSYLQTACIGPAGENRLHAATIEHGVAASASRGVGAIMGDKNLKAITIIGSGSIKIAEPDRFVKLCEKINARSGPLMDYAKNASSTIIYTLAPHFNFFDGKAPYDGISWAKSHFEFQKQAKTRQVSCYNCGAACKQAYSHNGKDMVAAKCVSLFGYRLLSNSDWKTAYELLHLCVGYGLCSTGFPPVVAMGIDLAEKGVIRPEDTDGLSLKWGDINAIKLMMKKIVQREGIGDILADGTEKASKRLLGDGADNYLLNNIKGTEQQNADLYIPLIALLGAVNPRGDLTRALQWFPTDAECFFASHDDPDDFNKHYPGYDKCDTENPLQPFKKLQKESYIEDGFFNMPKELEPLFLDDAISFTLPESHMEQLIGFIDYGEKCYTMSDITGICSYWTGHFLFPPVSDRDKTSIDVMADLITLATGYEISGQDALKICERTECIIKAYNMRAGLRRSDDTVPDKYFNVDPPPMVPFKKLDRKKFEQWLDYYYSIKKWQKSGFPDAERLDALGLEFVKTAMKNMINSYTCNK